MGGALARGVLAAGADPASVVVSAKDAQAACDFAKETGARPATSNTELVTAVGDGIVVVAVKPYAVAGVLEEISDAARAAGKLGGTPDLLIVNPPRRGLTDLTEWIAVNPPRWLIYSSCNPTTLAKDLGLLDGFAVHEARLMDMFPQTGHMECMVLAERVD